MDARWRTAPIRPLLWQMSAYGSINSVALVRAVDIFITGGIPMKDYQAKNLRNVSVVGHGSVGKTTLVEALLFSAGAIDRQGRVEDGAATTDYDPEEDRKSVV